MRFQHVGCGGEIDVKNRQCTRCKKKWNPIAFRLDPTSIRPLIVGGRPAPDKDKIDKLNTSIRKANYAKWAEKVPGATILPRLLPKWPRWTRILTTAVFVVVVVLVILWAWGVL